MNDIKDHLMLCGNQTDPCPVCLKRIRRAIFAYHYENNCAQLDENISPAITVPIQGRPQSASSTSSSKFLVLTVERFMSFILFVFIKDYTLRATSNENDHEIPCEICHKPIPFSNYDNHAVSKLFN